MGGFGRFEQYVLATLVHAHRKKIKQSVLGELDEPVKSIFNALLVCLRLAVLFNRRREDVELHIQLKYAEDQFSLIISDDWLSMNPLTRAGLLKEIPTLSQLNINLLLESKQES